MYPNEMLSALKNADNFMVCSHIRPDGDAIGSLLATGRLLRALGKTCTLISQDGVPRSYQCLPDATLVRRPEEVQGQRFDAAIAVDVSGAKRIGSAYPFFEQAPLQMVIDHHPTNERSVPCTLVEPAAAATGELIVSLWEEMGVPLDADAAFQLYCAINADTGNFCFNSVSARTFECMQRLMEAGLDIALASRKLFMTRSRGHVALLGRALSSMVYFAGGEATCMHLSKADKEQCGATDEDVGGIVNYGLYLDGVRMTFTADESEQGWKVSLRALPGLDVSQIATRFGGGGHVLASGCLIPGDYAEVEKALQAAMEEALRA